jgi:hypothetical protein
MIMQGVSPRAAGIALVVVALLGIVLAVACGVVASMQPPVDHVATQQAEQDLKAQNYAVGTTRVTIKDGVQEGETYLKELRHTFVIAIVDGKWQPVCPSVDGVNVPLSNSKLNEDVYATRRCPVGFQSAIYITG